MVDVLTVSNLSIDFNINNDKLNVVKQLSFSIKPKEVVCLVGESGSGKTVTSMAIMRLVEYEKGMISEGDIKLEGEDITHLPQSRLRNIRGSKIAMIFQEPMSAFDPVYTIGAQIEEEILQHKKVSKKEATKRAKYLLEKVGLNEVDYRMNQYPHELSGGMLQRAMIAMALSCNPTLLIADEPTTALDVTVQAQILDLLNQLKEEFNMSILLITHDLGVASRMADRILVMYAGKLMEQAAARTLFSNSRHPYTRGLLNSIITNETKRKTRLFAINGTIPSLKEIPKGCRFAPRCEYATELCKEQEPPIQFFGEDQVACWYSEKVLNEQKNTLDQHNKDERTYILDDQPILLDVKNLKKHFPVKKELFSFRSQHIHAVDGVSLQIRQGETFGLVGESGSGKSTLGRLLVQLEKPTSGDISFEGEALDSLSGKQLRDVRKQMQVIFQDPYGSINPRWKLGKVIGEPLRNFSSDSDSAIETKVKEVMEMVGLKASWYNRYPHEFSGGQRQRIVIARAITMKPKFILADEAVSALDVSIQAQVINLLQDLQKELGLTFLFIAHGLQVVRHISDRIGVMYLGKIVEIAPADDLFAHPAHPYTQTLNDSILNPEAELSQQASDQKINSTNGEIPSQISPPSGCRFHTRCVFATDKCKKEEPTLTNLNDNRAVACHYPLIHVNERSLHIAGGREG
ncbi:ABC transporter ATP-binding protein [Alkalicoccobacillus porphyridii]|uniref:ABC transporter ATP-binding protein n=1 Tax=Alkalicoccobacillus porphyridii TaxID=2597270 RepID=A0A554A2H0_9BACI|nr:ABC transporter ATP-binding protein [Alkalicoccobacillus porphyridii]TSB47846.1 ABC transporter ATP-binding protein [Alkalicoccobacillus porphyridii]